MPLMRDMILRLSERENARIAKKGYGYTIVTGVADNFSKEIESK
ncbi:MAG: hypothetical protein R6U44_04895 [Archaeoglobaceae archaeon]